MSATPTPATVHPPRPFYVRNATTHRDVPGRFFTREEAQAARAQLSQRDRGFLFIVREGWATA